MCPHAQPVVWLNFFIEIIVDSHIGVRNKTDSARCGVHAFNPISREAEAGLSLSSGPAWFMYNRVSGKLGLLHR